ncbi:MAG TPA: hypothetical protein VJ327_03210 [Patescibacteria group bacterium]|nr:hypothetical protein [Patescibacteria group bacterium]
MPAQNRKPPGFSPSTVNTTVTWHNCFLWEENEIKKEMPPVPPVVTYKISSSTLPDGTRIYTLWTIVEIQGELLTTVFVEPLLPHS